jgi:hypothetical protein
MRVKFSQQLDPMTFKMELIIDFAAQIICLFVKKVKSSKVGPVLN